MGKFALLFRFCPLTELNSLRVSSINIVFILSLSFLFHAAFNLANKLNIEAAESKIKVSV